MKMTRVAVLALVALFAATDSYAASSQRDTIPATATVNNGNTLNSISVLWTHKSLDCGTFVPTAAAATPAQRYAAGAACLATGADATASVTQSNANPPVGGTRPQPFTVTATDLGASAAPGVVTLLNPAALLGPHTLAINLSLRIDAAPAAFGTPFTEASALTSTIDIGGSLAQAIGYSDAADGSAYESGSYQGSFDVVVSL